MSLSATVIAALLALVLPAEELGCHGLPLSRQRGYALSAARTNAARPLMTEAV